MAFLPLHYILGGDVDAMRFEFNPWKIVMYLIAVIASSIFVIPTKQMIEQFIYARFGYMSLFLELIIYVILWRIWDAVERLWKVYREMPDK